KSKIKTFEPTDAVKNGKLSIPIDLIRVTAIFLVIFLHVTNTYFNQATLDYLSYTEWSTFVVYKSIALSCVPLFVILTGALLLQPSKIDEPIGAFLKKRAKRIGLAFVFWTLIYLAWSFQITNTPFTYDTISLGLVTSFFTGAYYHFWYLYLIAGLYLITPLLRAGIAFKNLNLISYLIGVWLVGICIVPFLPLLTGFNLPGEVFVAGGFTGFFLMGAYLQKKRLKRRFIYGFLIIGFIFTLASTWVMTYHVEPVSNDYTFFDYLAINVVVMSIGAYAFLLRFPADWPGKNRPYAKKIIHTISKNTLPIYLLHVIVLETFARGLLGVTLDLTILPAIQVPLASIAILFITLGLILLMKKVPGLKKLVG
ncbi:MAG TPA: acyltransferase family protein, partial [Candidatus Acidoferrales bacterium]|nr:acyltransferase family protein [Candidatus Acidoferrales bacterium]